MKIKPKNKKAQRFYRAFLITFVISFCIIALMVGVMVCNNRIKNIMEGYLPPAKYSTIFDYKQ